MGGEDTTLKRSRKASRDEQEERQELVWKLRVDYGMSYAAIVDYLSKQTPAIHTTKRKIELDLFAMRMRRAKQSIRTGYAQQSYEERKSRYEYLYREATTVLMSRDATNGDRLRAIETASSVLGEALALDQQYGLVHKNLGTLFLASQGKTDERIPNGIELGRLMGSADVVEGEIISDAERARRYGEYAALPAGDDRDRDDVAGDSAA